MPGISSLSPSLALTLFTGLLATAAVSPSNAQARAQGLERDPIAERLDRATAAPTTGGREYPASRSLLPDQSQVVGYDPATGEISVREGSALSARAFVPADPSFEPEPPLPLPQPLSAPSGAEDPSGGVTRIAPTLPGPVAYAGVYPWLTIYKVLMIFRVGASEYSYVCSAWAANEFFLVTAGHCVYNHDPNHDGDTSDARWATEIFVWPGQGDVVAPDGVADRPRGIARGVYFRAYYGWINDGNFDYDMGSITLDRRVGIHTGWMGRSDDVLVSVNYSGYPSEQPYVPAGNLLQYHGYDANNVNSTTDFRVHLDAFIYGGHSGGPSWRFVDPDRWVTGIHSTSNRVGSAWDTRLSAARRTDINDWSAQDESVRPPIARPDVIEYLFNGNNHKGISPTVVEQGGTFTARYNLMNSGFAPTGTITVDFYLSVNDRISPADTYLGSQTLPSLLTNYFFAPDPTILLTVPPKMPPQAYHVGWIMRTAVPEYGSVLTCEPGAFPCDNAVAIGYQTLTVVPCTVCPIFADGFESGNTSAWSP